MPHKWFLGERSYTMGAGAEVIIRWRWLHWLQPFSSTFAEYLIGARRDSSEGHTDRVSDHFLIRNLTGVLFPGRAGDIQIFNAIEVGDGKGLNVYDRELRWGGGIRLAFP